MNELRALYATATALALAWGLLLLLERRWGLGREGSEAPAQPQPGLRAARFFLLALWCSLVLNLTSPQGPTGLESAALAAVCLAAGTVCFAVVGGRGALVPGVLCGASFVALGLLAGRWVPMSGAISRLGTGVFGAFLYWGLPAALAASLALAAAAILHPDLAGLRGRVLAGILLLWLAPTVLAEWRLRAAWGFGPATLSRAAGVPPAETAARSMVAVLRPRPRGGSWRFEPRRQAAEGLDASPESLARLHGYLLGQDWRSVFARQGVAALRRGWLDLWDAERALDAAALGVPGRVVPDYQAALGLIRAGPLTPERFARLEALHDLATADSAGFENVSTSQLIFEAFSAAFARFEDEPRARYWLGRVDNLWPINDKKVEVTPLERMRDGSVEGLLLIDGRPASSVQVGLFWESYSEVTKKTSVVLSGAAYPDARGAFRFERLGAGRYHLELRGTPEQLRGEVLGSPGYIDLSESRPAARLALVMIERRGPGPSSAEAQDWLRAEAQAVGEVFRPRAKR